MSACFRREFGGEAVYLVVVAGRAEFARVQRFFVQHLVDKLLRTLQTADALDTTAPGRTVLDNTLIANLEKYVGRNGLLDEKRGVSDAMRHIEMLRVKTPSVRTHVENLSGGNQQKVIVARWLLTDPEILILD